MTDDLSFRLRADSSQAVLGTRKYREELSRVRDTAQRASDRMRDFGSSQQVAAGGSRNLGFVIQNTSYQVGDFAVQVAGGTAASRAFAQQLPQLLGGLGVFGAVAGAAAAILIPLGARLLASGENASDAADAIDRLSSATNDAQSDVDNLRSLTESLNRALRDQGPASKAGAAAVIANTREEIKARRERLRIEVQLLALQKREALDTITRLQKQQQVARDSVLQTLNNTTAPSRAQIDGGGFAGGGLRASDIDRQIANAGAGDAINQMRNRQKEILDLQVQVAELSGTATEAKLALDGIFVTDEGLVSGESLGGSDGKSGGKKKSRKKAIKEQQTALQELLASTKGTLNEQLGAWENYFSNLATLSGTNSRQLLGIAKTFGAAQALIDAWGAYAKTLNDPTLPWWGRIAAALQVLSAGLGAVNAIKSVTAGGGGGAGANGGRGATGGSASASASGSGSTAQTPLQVQINPTGPMAQFFAEMANPLFDALNKEAGSRGYTIARVGS